MALKMNRQMARPGASPNRMAQNNAHFGKQPTPQQKMVDVFQKLGIPGLKDQQGTTRTVYHALPITEGAVPATTFFFFKNVKNTVAPFTNITENKFQAGEAMAVERVYFGILTITDATGAVANFQTLDAFAMPGYFLSQYNLKIGSQDYTKDNTLVAFKPEFNHNALHTTYNIYNPGVHTVIPPDVQFYVNLDVPTLLNPSSGTLTFYLVCFLEGDGAILNMKQTL